MSSGRLGPALTGGRGSGKHWTREQSINEGNMSDSFFVYFVFVLVGGK